MNKNPRIAILTGGGDCPGINAVIRAVAKEAILEHDAEIIGIEDGYEGLIQNRWRKLTYEDVSGIITLGGTILGTSNTANPYRQAVMRGDKLEFADLSQTAIANARDLDLQSLVVIGGDGTLNIGYRLFRDGLPVVGVPKTIDNDLRGTDISFGFDSAVAIDTDCIDRVHTTAQSHHRVMIVEVMGREAGWIALYSGIAGGGDILLLPEIPYDIDIIAAKVKERNQKGKRFTIVVVAEGAKPVGGSPVIARVVRESTDPLRLGGISFVLANQIEKASHVETRAVVIGHVQRGGAPTAFDRVLATRLGGKAVHMALSGRFGYMAGVKGNELCEVALEEVARGPRCVRPDDPLIATARAVGTCFGDK